MYLKKIRFKGFTLIELLIVIVIIGILVSIALPNFIAAQTRAKTASLKSNIRSLAIVAQTYSVDWGGNVAENVATLHTEALAKNYWKDFKNPFTGEAGYSFAVSNYSQSVNLITSLHNRFACENCFMIAASNYSATNTGSDLPATDVFSKPGMAAYLTNGSDWLIAGGIPDGKGSVKWLTERGRLVSLASSDKVRIAVDAPKDLASGSGYLGSMIDKVVSQLSPQFKNVFKSNYDAWFANKYNDAKNMLAWTDNYKAQIKTNLDNIFSGLTDDQRQTAQTKLDKFVEAQSNLNKFQAENFEKFREWDKFWAGKRLEGADKQITAQFAVEIALKKPENQDKYNSLLAEANAPGGCWNGGDQTVCSDFNSRWNQFNQSIYDDPDVKAKQQAANDYWNAAYDSKEYKAVANELQPLWDVDNKNWSDFYAVRQEINDFGNSIGNADYSKNAVEFVWSDYNRAWYEKTADSKAVDEMTKANIAYDALYSQEKAKLFQ